MEQLIFENAKEVSTIYNISRFANELMKNTYQNFQWTFEKEFNEIKLWISKWIQELDIYDYNKLTTVKNLFNDFENDDETSLVIFNYTKNFWKSYKGEKYFIHGTHSDKEKIVFGATNKFSENNKNNVLEGRVSAKYDFVLKTFQLIDLDNSNCLQVEDLKELVIIGHSIGINDYTYFHNIIALNKNITLKVLWYEYSDGTGDNLKSSKRSLFRMLNEYEILSGIDIVSNMILKNKIKFEKVKFGGNDGKI